MGSEEGKRVLMRKLQLAQCEQQLLHHAAAIIEGLAYSPAVSADLGAADGAIVRAQVRELGGIAPLVQLVGFSPNAEVVNKAAAALGRLALDHSNATVMVAHNALYFLLQKTKSGGGAAGAAGEVNESKMNERREAANALATLIRYPDINTQFARRYSATCETELVGLLSMVDGMQTRGLPIDFDCGEKAMAALANICLGSDNLKKAISHSASIRAYLSVLESSNAAAAAPGTDAKVVAAQAAAGVKMPIGAKGTAAALLGNLANHNEHIQLKLGTEGAIAALLAAIKNNEAGGKAASSLPLVKNAAMALRNLTEVEANCGRVLKNEGLELLMQLLLKHHATGTARSHLQEQICVNVVATLRNLTNNDDSGDAGGSIGELGGLQLLTEMLSPIAALAGKDGSTDAAGAPLQLHSPSLVEKAAGTLRNIIGPACSKNRTMLISQPEKVDAVVKCLGDKSLGSSFYESKSPRGDSKVTGRQLVQIECALAGCVSQLCSTGADAGAAPVVGGVVGKKADEKATAAAGGQLARILLTRAPQLLDRLLGCCQAEMNGDDDEEASEETGRLSTLSDERNLMLAAAASAVENIARALTVADSDASMNGEELKASMGAKALPVVSDLLQTSAMSVRAAGASAICALLEDSPENQVAVASLPDVVPALVFMLSSLHRREKLYAAGALWQIAMDRDNRIAVASAGAIEPLVQLQCGGGEDAGVVKYATSALDTLSINSDNAATIEQMRQKAESGQGTSGGGADSAPMRKGSKQALFGIGRKGSASAGGTRAAQEVSFGDVYSGGSDEIFSSEQAIEGAAGEEGGADGEEKKKNMRKSMAKGMSKARKSIAGGIMGSSFRKNSKMATLGGIGEEQ
jgi:hypothetical protein